MHPSFSPLPLSSLVSQTRTETLRSINQRGNKVQTFFLAHTTFHLRRPATVSCDLSAKRRCTAQPRELNQAGPSTDLQATSYGPVIPHSYTYATLLRDRGERQSGSNVGVPNTVPWHAEHGISVLEMSLL